MLMYVFLALVGVFTVTAVARWRVGVLLLILTAMIQDPVRKLVPGVPSYLVLACSFVWLGMIVGAGRKGEFSLNVFRYLFPLQWRWLAWYMVALIVPAFLSLTYGPGSWQFALLGVFAQLGFIGSILLGLVFPRKEGDLAALLKWYCVLSALMMVGGVLERWDMGMSSGVIGTRMFGALWITHRMGEGLRMMSGFFRSPDVMGWHAATLVMFGCTLALGAGGWRRFGWAALAGWGCVALMFCARRKMISMVPVFGIVVCVLYVIQGKYGRLVRLLLTGGVIVGAGAYLYFQAGANDDLERFYASTLGELDTRVQVHGVDAVVDTYRQAGFWGHGLGMAIQGSHNITGAKPRTWQESGPSMLAAELGIPGLLAFCLLAAGLLVAGFQALGNAVDSPEHPLLLGVAAVVVANMSAGVVSSQIFGDPFIGCFVPFLGGLMLSGARLRRVDVADGEERG